MKQRKLLLLPLLALVLGGCKPTPSETPTSQTPGSSQTETPSISVSIPDVSVSVSEVALTTIEEARTKTGEVVTISGRITSIFAMASNTMSMTIQQGDFGLTAVFIQPTEAAKFVVGDHARVTGEIALFNGLVQLNKISAMEKLTTAAPAVTPFEITTWSEEALTNMDARIVKISGLTYVSKKDAGGNTEYTLKFGTVDLPMLVSQYLVDDDKTAILDLMNSVRSVDTVNFEGPLGWYKVPQLNPVNAGTITVVKGQDPVDPVPPTHLSFAESDSKLIVGATLQLTVVKAPNDADISSLVFASSAPAVATVSDTGLVTAVADGVAEIRATVGLIVAKVNITVATPVASLINSFNFLDGGTNNNTDYNKVDLETKITYAQDDPSGATGTTDWLASRANLNLTYGTRLGGRAASEVQTDNSAWANVTSTFTFGEIIDVIEVRNAVYFHDDALTRLGNLYLQSSLDGLTWVNAKIIELPGNLQKSASGYDGITISLTDLNIPANSYIRLGVTFSVGDNNAGFQFGGIAVFGLDK